MLGLSVEDLPHAGTSPPVSTSIGSYRLHHQYGLGVCGAIASGILAHYSYVSGILRPYSSSAPRKTASLAFLIDAWMLHTAHFWSPYPIAGCPISFCPVPHRSGTSTPIPCSTGKSLRIAHATAHGKLSILDDINHSKYRIAGPSHLGLGMCDGNESLASTAGIGVPEVPLRLME